MIRATLLAVLLTGCNMSAEASPVPDGTQSARGEVRESAVGWHRYPDPVPGGASYTTEISTAIVGGTASWYDYNPGEAAAGPLLRELLGSGWRGTVVRVHYREAYVDVALTDACQCFRGTPDDRLIDLDVRSFAALADPAKGLLEVQVTLR